MNEVPLYFDSLKRLRLSETTLTLLDMKPRTIFYSTFLRSIHVLTHVMLSPLLPRFRHPFPHHSPDLGPVTISFKARLFFLVFEGETVETTALTFLMIKKRRGDARPLFLDH